MANKYCPLCGEENNCSKDANCWCSTEQFPQGIFELVPIESRRKHCICQSCVTKYKEKMGKS